MRFTGRNHDLAVELVIGDMRIGRANETLVYDGQGWVTCGDFAKERSLPISSPNASNFLKLVSTC